MSLGMLGEYGSVSSGSEISDSDEEFEKASSDKPASHCTVGLDSCGEVTKNAHTGRELLVAGGSANDGLKTTGLGVDSDPLNYVQDDVSSSEDNDCDSEEDASPVEKNTSVPLPLPDLDHLTSPAGVSSITGSSSVFSNPYKEAEEAKLAILKRHVSDFAPDEKPSPRTRTKRYKAGRDYSRNPRQGSATFSDATSAGSDPHGLFNDDDSSTREGALQGKRKQRSGVSSNLIPPKKYLKGYEKIQAEERPWTVRTRK